MNQFICWYIVEHLTTDYEVFTSLLCGQMSYVPDQVYVWIEYEMDASTNTPTRDYNVPSWQEVCWNVRPHSINTVFS